jgi:hypothetical protein
MVEVYETSDAKIFGRSYGEWTSEWWRWVVSTPTSMNPLVDNSGLHASAGQPSHVWFLAGSFPSSDRNYPARKVQIPSETSILFPVINCEASRLEYPELDSEEDLKDHVRNDMSTIVKKDCFINGDGVPPQRVKSEPEIFQITINEDNPFGISHGGTTSATSDGYWVFLKPPRKGHYLISFQGSCEQGRLNSGASYDIEIF